MTAWHLRATASASQVCVAVVAADPSMPLARFFWPLGTVDTQLAAATAHAELFLRTLAAPVEPAPTATAVGVGQCDPTVAYPCTVLAHGVPGRLTVPLAHFYGSGADAATQQATAQEHACRFLHALAQHIPGCESSFVGCKQCGWQGFPRQLRLAITGAKVCPQCGSTGFRDLLRPLPGFQTLRAFKAGGHWRVVDCTPHGGNPYQNAIGETQPTYRALCAWASARYTGDYD